MALDKDGTQYCHEETLVWRWHLSPSPVRVWAQGCGEPIWQEQLWCPVVLQPCLGEPLTASPGRQLCQGSGAAAALVPLLTTRAHKGIQQAALQQHFPWHKTATVASVEGNGSGASSQDRMGGVLWEQ